MPKYVPHKGELISSPFRLILSPDMKKEAALPILHRLAQR